MIQEKPELNYRAKGMGAPHGKLAIYFCALPEDFKRYFEEVVEDIFHVRQDCAIWFDAENTTKSEEKTVGPALSEMHLFVMPVTARLLDGENEAVEKFRFAVAHQIPVLPILEERGLEDVYNRICGEVQLLDAVSTDKTAIAYRTKLSDYLNNVLPDEVTLHRIRAAFRARIFLSYRKKDRAYAQKLMRLIHAQPSCHDIAIWYDEFLIPGMHFRDLIMEELDGCDLFRLAVTPNLLEDGNFVLTEEYPAACAVGKPILPVELAETDRDALSVKFRGLPPLLDPEDGAAIADAIRKYARHMEGADPSHD